MTYYKFIPSYASVVEALRSLLRGFTWTDTAQVAFSRVKELIAPNLSLTLFDPALPTLVTTDACDYGIGAVLTQLHGYSEKTVAFASRSHTDCDRSPIIDSFLGINKRCTVRIPMFLLNEQMHNSSLWFHEGVFFYERGAMWYVPVFRYS